MKPVKTYVKHEVIEDSETSQNVYEFLKSRDEGVLATVDKRNKPHAVVVYYTVNKDFSVVFTTKRDTKKFENLQHNHNAMLVVYDPLTQTTVQIEGTTQEVKDVKKSQKAFDEMLRAASRISESPVPPISKLHAGYYASIQLTPKQIRMAMFLRPDPGGYDIFETLSFD